MPAATHSGATRIERRSARAAEERRRALLALLAERGELTMREAATALGCSLLGLDYPVRSLAAQGRVEVGWRWEPGAQGRADAGGEGGAAAMTRPLPGCLGDCGRM